MKLLFVLLNYFLRALASLFYRTKLFIAIVYRRDVRLVKKRKINNNIVIYTAIFWGWDSLKDPPHNIPGCDFACFTDNIGLQSDYFDMRVSLPPSRNSNRRSAKIFKILPHKYFHEYEYSVWIDGSVRIKTAAMKQLVDQFLGEHDLAVLVHPDRNCIYDELVACLEANKDDPQTMTRQVESYRKAGYPPQHGLATCPIIFRRQNSRDVIDFCEDWYKEIENGSQRDQLSSGYVAWKRHFEYRLIEENVRDNKIFKIEKHRKQGPPNDSFLTHLIDKFDAINQIEANG